MAFAIAKPAMFDCAYYVTAIRRGGLTLDNVRHDPTARLDARWQARTWATERAARASLDKLHRVGGFDDYAIVTLD